MTSRSPVITTLSSGDGMTLEAMDFGARLCRLTIPLADGPRKVVLGYAQPADYVKDPYYMGACIGRHAGRIANAEISINNQQFQLDKNEPSRDTCLHGGRDGFSQRYWKKKTATDTSVEYELNSNHQDQGFPGNIQCSIRYSIAQQGEFSIEFNAVSNQDTVINLAHHAYYNLNGDTRPGQSTIETHSLLLPWTEYIPLSASMLPLGNKASIEQLGITPNSYHVIGDLLSHANSQISQTGGLDHYMLAPVPCTDASAHNLTDKLTGKSLQHAATLQSDDARVTMHVHATHPGAHIYTGNFLSSPWRKHQGICFETQGFPQGLQQSNTSANVLLKNTHYTHTMRFRFEST